MSISEMIEHLQRAQEEIRLVEQALNGNSHACTSCGLTVRDDFGKYQTRLQLEANRKKLQKVAKSLLSAKRSRGQAAAGGTSGAGRASASASSSS